MAYCMPFSALAKKGGGKEDYLIHKNSIDVIVLITWNLYHELTETTLPLTMSSRTIQRFLSQRKTCHHYSTKMAA